MTTLIRIAIGRGPEGDVPFLHVSLGRLATLFSAADAIIAEEDVAGLMSAICGTAAREGGEANVALAAEWRDRFAALAFCGDCESAPCCCEFEERAIPDADRVRATHVDEDDVNRLDLEPEDEPGTAALRCPRCDAPDPAGFRYMEDVASYRKLDRFDAAGTLHVDGHFEVGDDGDHPRFLCEACDTEFSIPEGLEYEFD